MSTANSALLGIIILVITMHGLLLSSSLNNIEDAMSTAEIAGTRVPAVSCQEDEAIWWIGPDTLGCVHFEEVR